MLLGGAWPRRPRAAAVPNVSQPTISINVRTGRFDSVMRDAIVNRSKTRSGTQDLQTLSSNIQSGQASISAAFVITSDQNTDLVNTQKALTQPSTTCRRRCSRRAAIRDPLKRSSSRSASRRRKMTAPTVVDRKRRIIPYSSKCPTYRRQRRGSVTPAYEVVADPAKISAYNLTLNDLITTVGPATRGRRAALPTTDRETQIDIRATSPRRSRSWVSRSPRRAPTPERR